MRKISVLFVSVLIISNSMFGQSTPRQKAVPAGAIVAYPNKIWKNDSPTDFYDASGNKIYSVAATWYDESPAAAAWYVSSTAITWIEDYNSKNTPKCNLDHYMRPFWTSDTIYSETVLMKNNSFQVKQKLLFPPKKVLSIKSFDGTKTYKEGVDYTVSSDGIITDVSNALSLNFKTTVGKNGMTFYQSAWVLVTYTPNRSNWKKTNFTQKADKLPKTMDKLSKKLPLKIVALGMSITRGFNVSGFAGDDNCGAAAPFMPNYIDMFTNRLKLIYGYNDITTVNASLPGQTSTWMLNKADLYVNPNKPDLVIIDMGMNDTNLDAATFKSNVEGSMKVIKDKNPDVEFILLGGMLIDPKSSGMDPVATNSKLRSFQTQLSAIEGANTTGVANVDMTTMSDTIFNRKLAKDCLTNYMHPNDYLARWFAQGLVAAFAIDNIKLPSDLVNINAYINSDLLSINPNPVVDGHFIIKLSEEITSENTIISIFDISGKQVASFNQSSNTKDYLSTDLNMSSGVYIFKAQVDGKVSTQKVVVK